MTIVVALSLTSCHDDDGNTVKPNAKTFVIVHGAWQAPYAWAFVKTELEQQGQKVVVVELPAHGSDTTDPTKVTMAIYRDKVIAAIKATNTKVILVGHSLGGVVITEVAEAIPDQIQKLVYIGAFLPATGQSLYALATSDAESQLAPNLHQLPNGTLDVPKDKLVPIFIADGSAGVQQLVIDNYRAEPAIPFFDTVALTAANFGRVDKYYIRTLNDQVIGPKLQLKMIAAAGITKTYPISTSHCAFLAKPDSVTILLMNISK